MMMWYALGSLAMLAIAGSAAGVMIYRAGKADGRDELRAEMAENRAARRAEAKIQAAARGHQLSSFPDEQEFEKLATTGELFQYAETGDLGSLERESAAFFRILSLREWTRKKESAA